MIICYGIINPIYDHKIHSKGDSMYKKQRIIKSTISIIIVITLIVLGVINEYNHGFYDKGKNNIFEIPDTVSIISSNVNNEELVIVNNYISQDIPSNTVQMKK